MRLALVASPRVGCCHPRMPAACPQGFSSAGGPDCLSVQQAALRLVDTFAKVQGEVGIAARNPGRH